MKDRGVRTIFNSTAFTFSKNGKKMYDGSVFAKSTSMRELLTEQILSNRKFSNQINSKIQQTCAKIKHQSDKNMMCLDIYDCKCHD